MLVEITPVEVVVAADAPAPLLLATTANDVLLPAPAPSVDDVMLVMID